jgi:hypothetical protein
VRGRTVRLASAAQLLKRWGNQEASIERAHCSNDLSVSLEGNISSNRGNK